jgi:hypothetical protein
MIKSSKNILNNTINNKTIVMMMMITLIVYTLAIERIERNKRFESFSLLKNKKKCNALQPCSHLLRERENYSIWLLYNRNKKQASSLLLILLLFLPYLTNYIPERPVFTHLSRAYI